MNSQQRSIMFGICSVYRNEKGIVTAVGLLLLAALTLLGTTAVMVTSTDILIGGNYKTSEQAFYAAEAGAEEARARLRANAGANLISDATHETAATWFAYIGSTTQATEKGFVASQALQTRSDSLQPALGYVVKILHRTDSDNHVLYWGDGGGTGVSTRNTASGTNIYLVTSYGSAARSTRTVEVEMARLPPITIPSALYTEAPTTIQGTSTHINGNDSCGGPSKPGIGITLADGSVRLTGNPTIKGAGAGPGNPPDPPSIRYDSTNLDMQTMVDSLKSLANYSYTVTRATQSGMNWGTPTLGATQHDPSSCSVSNIVRYNTSGTYISLTGGSSGCGILLVEGNLNVHGGFTWYGPILVTGSVTYTGGGDKQVTGAILAGGSVDADVVGGNADIVYCSTAVEDQTKNRPLKILSWHEK